jgi:hypothetical protein
MVAMGQGNGALVRVQSLKNQSVLADKCYVADSFLDRLRGLMGKSELRSGEGMLLRPCRDIHMWFMKIPIDVIFLRPERNAEGGTVWKVSSAHENVRPWRALPLMDARAAETLELPVGTIRRCAITAGDELCIS